MSIISAIRDYVETCPLLESGAIVFIDRVNAQPVTYSIVPMPGNRIVERYIDGGSLREYPFALQTTQSTADDLARIESAGFNESFADWLEAQTEAGTLPSLDEGKTAESVEAVQWGFLYEEGESSTGIYQIVCKLTYHQP